MWNYEIARDKVKGQKFGKQISMKKNVMQFTLWTQKTEQSTFCIVKSRSEGKLETNGDGNLGSCTRNVKAYLLERRTKFISGKMGKLTVMGIRTGVEASIDQP